MTHMLACMQVSNVFAGKRGFITARDLFKWTERQPAGPQAFAEEGYLLLGERLRTPAEQADVLQALEATWRVKVRHAAHAYAHKSLCLIANNGSAGLRCFRQISKASCATSCLCKDSPRCKMALNCTRITFFPEPSLPRLQTNGNCELIICQGTLHAHVACTSLPVTAVCQRAHLLLSLVQLDISS